MDRYGETRGKDTLCPEAEKILQQGLSDSAAEFRHGQWEAIDALVNQRHRVLVVERTGWGKSMVYVIATRIRRSQGHGLTLIILALEPFLKGWKNP